MQSADFIPQPRGRYMEHIIGVVLSLTICAVTLRPLQDVYRFLVLRPYQISQILKLVFIHYIQLSIMFWIAEVAELSSLPFLV